MSKNQGKNDSSLDQKTIEQISQIIKGGDYNVLVSLSDELGKKLPKLGLSTSQIRNIFGEVKIIQMRGFDAEKNRFKLLKPKVNYAASRAKTKGATLFAEIIDRSISLVGDSVKRFENFVNFFESILAYHKVYGGK